MNQSSILIFGLLSLIQFISIYSSSTNYNNLRLRNYGLRLIVFKEKRLNKILFEIKKLLQIYYDKSLVFTAHGINTYNELSEEDKLIFETIISLCY
jgi:hypothetical protein